MRRLLVNETLPHECAPSDSDSAPESGRNAWGLLGDPLHLHGAECICRIGRTLDSVRVHSIFHSLRKEARLNRRAGDPMRPGYRSAALIERDDQMIVVIRPIHVVLNVLFARPHDFPRTIDLLCDLRGAHDAVYLESPPESSTEQMV